ncbi:Gfo/Idh/MocA family oxidoreductase [Clostridium boliviensis]|uniref:Gfo/Idh/MocA family oxidoreductase n=1 Tax=Clostridium boliviensis TaxID=318465 RepID=A0ABU4GUG5_9CLOT|nr:Gfo/Idh/MocA family oxidoreductase [Clostridium boliviensis]MDW2800632.1 Gfo/Idh/MocA family oxidoreductase [Clostridium boliviensis]
MESLKLGIIGCGGIANGKHLPSVKQEGRAEVVAFCDIVEERACEAAKKYGTKDAKVFTDYRELIKLDLDAVYVCTPNRSHCEITVAALNAGRHVMCEKPMAINYNQAMEMVEAARKTGKLLNIGYQNRYRADSIYLKQECANGELGEIYYAKAKAIRRRAVPTWGVFLNEYEQGGGPLIDIGTHALDLTLWMMNNYKPKSVVGTIYHKLNGERQPANAWGPWEPDNFTVEDSAFGFVIMEDGATITLEASWALNSLDVHEAKTVLCGTKAGADMLNGLTINGTKNDRLYELKPNLEAGGAAFYEGNVITPEVKEQQTFFDAILGKGELVVMPEQAAVVTQILDAVYQSAREGRQIIL